MIIKSRFKKNDLTYLEFYDKDTDTITDMQAVVYGGICMPDVIVTPTSVNITGYIVIVARDINTDLVYLLEEKRWNTVNHIVNDNKIEFEGITDYINYIWNQYYCDTFYHCDPRDRYKKYFRDLEYNQLLARQVSLPYMVTTNNVIISAIYEKIKCKQLIVNSYCITKTTKSDVTETASLLQSASWASDPGQLHRLIQCFGCVLIALDRINKYKLLK